MSQQVELAQDPQFKKYVLIDAIKSTAKIYLKTSDGGEGIRLDTPRRVGLYLRHIFTDKEGKQKKTRFKLGANSIWEDKQIKEDSIPANDKFSDDERGVLQLINGVMIVDATDTLINDFLDKENNPQREEFTGRNRNGITPLFRELDEVALSNSENDFIGKTALSLTKIMSMKMPEVTALLALFFGSSYPTPPTLKECQNIACKALENNEERMDMVIEGEWGVDGEITILLNKALNQGIISFETKPDQVQLKKNGQWIDVKMISADTYEQREILFRQYLATESGELLRNDIQNLVEGKATKSIEKPKK